MVTNLSSIELSLEKLEICPKQAVTVWVYGALQGGKGEEDRKVGGISAIFSVESMAPVSRTLFETRCSKLTINTIEIQACLMALDQAKTSGYHQVKLCTSSPLLQAIITTQLQMWKKKKWKKANGSRLVIPISLLKKLDKMLTVVDVQVDRVARGGCPQIVKAEALAKQSCIDFSNSPTGQNTNIVGAEETNISKQMERKIVSTIKQRQKEHDKRKLKRLKLRGMRKKIQLT